ncbi:MAG: hypothetical protein ACLTQI_04555 [Slackia sp.]
MAQNHPSVSAESIVAKGAVVDALVEQAQGHDLVVLGSHHGATVGETIGGRRACVFRFALTFLRSSFLPIGTSTRKSMAFLWGSIRRDSAKRRFVSASERRWL